jgi:dTDP-4-dehydrorhamnose reductase/dTDP-4-dehydrorhamnose 3,5-epimerase
MTPNEVSQIRGMMIFETTMHEDERGWFKENWHSKKMQKLSMNNFVPVQNNVSYNSHRGTIRGFHAEPWDKFVSVASGRVFAAWVDLRKGDGFGNTFTLEITPGVAVLVPKGVANAFQTLEENTVYSYLVNGHRDETREYKAVNLFDEEISIPWPIALEDSIISEKDKKNPNLNQVEGFPSGRIAILGGAGQLGREFSRHYPDAQVYDSKSCDINSKKSVDNLPWPELSVIINAAAFTKVDASEFPENKELLWKTNAWSVEYLARKCKEFGVTLIHFSSDYVFDGLNSGEYHEEDAMNPISEYGRSKAAGDLAALTAESVYIIRCSWVVGQGENFIRKMISLEKRGISPIVVDDQTGKLTFAEDVVAATKLLISLQAPFGIYNVTTSKNSQNWFQIASDIFKTLQSVQTVKPVSTSEFGKDKNLASRPPRSCLDTSKIESLGFVSELYEDALAKYISDSKH